MFSSTPPAMTAPIHCPNCGAAAGLVTEHSYRLANGDRRRLKRCGSCGAMVRTIERPGEPEQLQQEPMDRFTMQRSRKLTAEQVVAIRHAAVAGAPRRALAAQYQVSRQMISTIVRGDSWRLVGGPSGRLSCHGCAHYREVCAFGFPEAEDEPWFANECDLYQPVG